MDTVTLLYAGAAAACYVASFRLGRIGHTRTSTIPTLADVALANERADRARTREIEADELCIRVSALATQRFDENNRLVRMIADLRMDGKAHALEQIVSLETPKAAHAAKRMAEVARKALAA